MERLTAAEVAAEGSYDREPREKTEARLMALLELERAHSERLYKMLLELGHPHSEN